MADLWIIIALLITLIENIRPENTVMKEMLTDPLLTWSLEDVLPRLKRSEKTLKDASLNQDKMYRYHEMLKASQESFESIIQDERRLRRVVGDHNYEVMKEGSRMPLVVDSTDSAINVATYWAQVSPSTRHSSNGAGIVDHRRNAPRFQSAFGKRRARTQALRREKLNNQGMRSHLQHSRHTTSDYSGSE